jgi:hypothetical protein
MVNAFMEKIASGMKENGKAETSVKLYLGIVRKLNGQNDFKSIAFLKKKDVIQEKLDAIKNLSTRKSYLSAIMGVLKANKNTPKSLKDHYGKMIKEAMDMVRNDEKENANIKTAKQEENWIDWEDVVKRYDKLNRYVDGLLEEDTKQEIMRDKNAREKVARVMLLALYVLIPPRRTLDYFEMFVDDADDNRQKNYYDRETNEFVFNNYKTAKYGGQDRLKVPDDLKSVLERHIEFYDIKKGEKLLRLSSGKPPTTASWVGTNLNILFGKKISVSMLRHIYLTGKYGEQLDEMKRDAEMMAHTVTEQKNYIKTD